MTSYFLSQFFLLCYSSQTSCERALSISLEFFYCLWTWQVKMGFWDMKSFCISQPFKRSELNIPTLMEFLWGELEKLFSGQYSIENCLYVRWGLCSQFEHLETGSILIEPLKRFMIVLPGLMWSSHTEKFPERQFGRPPKISLIIRRADILSR